MIITNWLQAFRLRTLPLAIATIGTGVALAASVQPISWSVASLCLLTGVLLQILSNLANDYGDAIKGTDNSERIGPERTVQSGAISPGAMKNAIALFVILSLASGIGLLWLAFAGDINWIFVSFFGLGVASILAAIKYTVGKRAYGYSGFGDLFVILFFGPVAVTGTMFLLAGWQPASYLLPGFALGLFCAGVLNLNNMRDMQPDAAAGKNTLAVKLGFANAKRYHYALITAAIAGIAAFLMLSCNAAAIWFFAPAIPLFGFHIHKVVLVREAKDFDPLLKQLAISILLFALLFGFGLNAQNLS